jgi:hypothetical protein
MVSKKQNQTDDNKLDKPKKKSGRRITTIDGAAKNKAKQHDIQTHKPTDILIRISPGELMDRLSILEIKKGKIEDGEKLANVLYEYKITLELYKDLLDYIETRRIYKQFYDLFRELRTINNNIWVYEEEIRACESREQYDHEFIRYARLIYITNDKRAAIKKQINTLLDSDLTEEKSQNNYMQGRICTNL